MSKTLTNCTIETFFYKTQNSQFISIEFNIIMFHHTMVLALRYE